jgi:hypothetical protein
MLLKTSALDQLHDQETEAAVLAGAEQADDVRVSELGGDPGVAVEPLRRLRSTRRVGPEHLEGDVPLALRGTRPVDHSRGPLPQAGEQPVFPDGAPRRFPIGVGRYFYRKGGLMLAQPIEGSHLQRRLLGNGQMLQQQFVRVRGLSRQESREILIHERRNAILVGRVFADGPEGPIRLVVAAVRRSHRKPMSFGASCFSPLLKW